MTNTKPVSIDMSNRIWFLRMSLSAVGFALLFGYFAYENPNDSLAIGMMLASIGVGFLGPILYAIWGDS